MRAARFFFHPLMIIILGAALLITPLYGVPGKAPFYKRPEVIIPTAVIIALSAYYFRKKLQLILSDEKKSGTRITSIEAGDVEGVKKLMGHVIIEVLYPEYSVQEVLDDLEEQGIFEDLNTFSTTYASPHGSFLVVKKGEKIIGSAGISRIDKETAELRRMWFLPEARGKGLARKVVHNLFTFARENGYKKVLLEVHMPSKQQRALRFYKKLGFNPVKPFQKGDMDIVMEMRLE